jgi:hypothetical protein
MTGAVPNPSGQVFIAQCLPIDRDGAFLAIFAARQDIPTVNAIKAQLISICVENEFTDQFGVPSVGIVNFGKREFGTIIKFSVAGNTILLAQEHHTVPFTVVLLPTKSVTQTQSNPSYLR